MKKRLKNLQVLLDGGVAGTVLLGPLGALAGILLGGNKKEVAFVCYMKNGKKFMATTDGKSWKQIMAALF